MHHPTAFRIAGWLFVAGGLAYLALGISAQLRGGGGASSYLVLGLVGIVVGSSVLRWGRRKLQP